MSRKNKSMLKRKLICLFICLFVSNLYIYAGSGLIGRRGGGEGILSFEVGGAYLFGDVGGSMRQPIFGVEDLVFEHVTIAYSIGFRFRHRLTDNFGYRISLQRNNFSGSDEGSRLYYRGYIFEATISKATLQIEYNFLSRENFWLYAFSGGGVAHSSINHTGAPIRPQDSHRTEVTAPFISLGVGAEHRLSRRSTIGLEIGTHYFFSNYIDGLSTFYSRSNDVISFVMINFSYSIFGGGRINLRRCPCRWVK